VPYWAVEQFFGWHNLVAWKFLHFWTVIAAGCAVAHDYCRRTTARNFPCRGTRRQPGTLIGTSLLCVA
jgi:hypothetical protein